jgi:hypothetical protein
MIRIESSHEGQKIIRGEIVIQNWLGVAGRLDDSLAFWAL